MYLPLSFVWKFVFRNFIIWYDYIISSLWLKVTIFLSLSISSVAIKQFKHTIRRWLDLPKVARSLGRLQTASYQCHLVKRNIWAVLNTDSFFTASLVLFFMRKKECNMYTSNHFDKRLRISEVTSSQCHVHLLLIVKVLKSHYATHPTYMHIQTVSLLNARRKQRTSCTKVYYFRLIQVSVT